MLLFPQKDDAKSAQNEKAFYVLSSRKVINEELSQLLRLAGFNQVTSVLQDLDLSYNLAISEKDYGIVIDIGRQEYIDNIVPAILAMVPRGVWCCVVGDSDSIMLAQAFLRDGIQYFNLNSQRELFVQSAISSTNLKSTRWAVSISILGCKGGVGNSSIAYQTISNIVQAKEMPSLFVQGATGSRDLDLLTGKKMVQEIVAGQKNLDLMSSSSSLYPDLSLDGFQKYNFVLFEEAINTANKETLRQLVESSSCLVLVMDRSMASVRVARGMIEVAESLNRSQLAPRRLFICLNDSRPFSMNMLSIEDLQSLLGRPLDVVFPYNKQKDGITRFVGLNRKIAPIDQLTRLILGGAPINKGSLINRLMKNGRLKKSQVA
ncbi:tight adherance operon protein [Hafnia alvei]|uniref:tight adherance operon protein n=1 Tax=Hafnia alvei TaxID=569 RepID=UPI00103D3724|nr:tight adherance operon protein [Hafnia alvei]QBJ33006.1 tight adherance operon protein [Hafnia alvei]